MRKEGSKIFFTKIPQNIFTFCAFINENKQKKKKFLNVAKSITTWLRWSKKKKWLKVWGGWIKRGGYLVFFLFSAFVQSVIMVDIMLLKIKF